MMEKNAEQFLDRFMYQIERSWTGYQIDCSLKRYKERLQVIFEEGFVTKEDYDKITSAMSLVAIRKNEKINGGGWL